MRWLDELADVTASGVAGRRIAEVVGSDGDIEVHCPKNLTPAGDPVQLTFQCSDVADPPFSIRVRSPSGKVIIERVIRDELGGRSRGGSALNFRPEIPGDYRVEVKQVYGALCGQATLRVRFG